MASVESRSSDAGFSFLEVVVSMGILTTVALGVAQLMTMATMANFHAKLDTSTTTLAFEKMEQLRSLTWGYDSTALGLPVSDTTSNVSVDPADASGAGLNPSPGGSLTASTEGYVDYLDRNGAWVGNGANPPVTARFVRRWSIDPLPTNPNNTLILQVLVRTVEQDAAAQAQGLPRVSGESRLSSVKTRKAP